jgi:hypothetical protein
MTYTAEISRDNPTNIIFAVDQSGSMDERMSHGKSKAEFVADVLNKTIYTLVTNCTKADGVRNYFDIGVITYGGAGIASGLGGHAGVAVRSIVELANAPLRVEDRNRMEDDGAGGVLERRVKFPVWFDPTSSGGTPMCAGLTRVAEVLAGWCDAHPNSYPPTVIHVTDGASTDGDPEHVASVIRQLSTNDGSCLLFNIHVSTEQGDEIQFPATDTGLPDSYARLLFRMSSELPGHVAKLAVDKGYRVGDGARGFMYNADPKGIANFFDIGTRPRLTADR